ncbi:MAG: aminotransferase class I/II-fold pyridoxal phosphate-dependent enzyme, partial [Actinomycetota bacterium]
LAAWQRGRGRPWTALAWGLWGEVGMGVGLVEQLSRRGVRPLATAEALRLFDIAMRCEADHLIIAPALPALPALPPAMAPAIAGGVRPSAATATMSPPRSLEQLGQDLAATFRKALRVERISPDDNVLELGLDSMMAVEVASSLARLGFEIDPPLLFQLPTLQQLAEHLLPPQRRHEPAPPAPAPLVVSSEPRPFLERRLAAMNKDDYEIRERGDYLFEPVLSAARGGWIETNGRRLLNFASYSYLDLIGHPHINRCAREAIERFGTGTHGVRLLAGTTTLHRELEQTIAAFKGAEDAVVFSSGYMANLATIAALVGRGDYIIGDVFNHASIVDGCLLSGATFLQFAHNDLSDLERCLIKAGGAGKLVVVDAVFSMDGDIIDLAGVARLCQRYDAPLMVDEAHSLGVLGATGSGIEEHFGLPSTTVPIKMGTLSKAIPSVGGYVAGTGDLIFALKHGARGFMFSAAITPAQTAAARAAFEVISASPERTQKLAANTLYYRSRLHALGFDTLASETAVIPIICRSSQQAYDFAHLCQHRGLFVQPIVYPAVPTTTPRLRTIVTAGHTEQDLDTAIDLLARAGAEIGLISPATPGAAGIQ